MVELEKLAEAEEYGSLTPELEKDMSDKNHPDFPYKKYLLDEINKTIDHYRQEARKLYEENFCNHIYAVELAVECLEKSKNFSNSPQLIGEKRNYQFREILKMKLAGFPFNVFIENHSHKTLLEYPNLLCFNDKAKNWDCFRPGGTRPDEKDSKFDRIVYHILASRKEKDSTRKLEHLEAGITIAYDQKIKDDQWGLIYEYLQVIFDQSNDTDFIKRNLNGRFWKDRFRAFYDEYDFYNTAGDTYSFRNQKGWADYLYFIAPDAESIKKANMLYINAEKSLRNIKGKISNKEDEKIIQESIEKVQTKKNLSAVHAKAAQMLEGRLLEKKDDFLKTDCYKKTDEILARFSELKDLNLYAAEKKKMILGYFSSCMNMLETGAQELAIQLEANKHEFQMEKPSQQIIEVVRRNARIIKEGYNKFKKMEEAKSKIEKW